MLVTLHLAELRFFAHHGLYIEEKKQGNEFEMNVEVSFPSSTTIIREMDETINYAAVYHLIEKEMLQPRDLLETFLSELAELLKTTFPRIQKLKMSLYKLQMPLDHFEGKIGVHIEKDFTK